MLMSPLIWVSTKIGTESEAIDLAEGVYTGKVDSSEFSSRLWLAQVIRYPQRLRGMLSGLDRLRLTL